MTTAPELRTDRLVLTLGSQELVPAIVRFVQDNRRFLVPFEPVRPESYYQEPYWHEQVTRHLNEFRVGASAKFFLLTKSAPGQVVGTANFTNIVRGPAQFCFLGYSLAEKAQGQGLMTEALKAAIAYMFQEQGLHRIMANYMPCNEPSGKLLKRLGFTAEGFARDYLMINGQWEDHVLTALTNPDWRAH